MSDLRFIHGKVKLENLELPKPQGVDRQNGAFLIPKQVDGCLRFDMLILDKLNVNINEEWGPIGQLPSLN